MMCYHSKGTPMPSCTSTLLDGQDEGTEDGHDIIRPMLWCLTRAAMLEASRLIKEPILTAPRRDNEKRELGQGQCEGKAFQMGLMGPGNQGV